MPIVWSPSCPEGVSFICFSGCAFKPRCGHILSSHPMVEEIRKLSPGLAKTFFCGAKTFL